MSRVKSDLTKNIGVEDIWNVISEKINEAEDCHIVLNEKIGHQLVKVGRVSSNTGGERLLVKKETLKNQPDQIKEIKIDWREDPVFSSVKKMSKRKGARKLAGDCKYEETKVQIVNITASGLSYFHLKLTRDEYIAEHLISK